MSAARRPCFPEPFFLQWHITSRCNLACAHCYQGPAGRPDLDFAAMLGVLDRFAAFLGRLGRAGRVHLTGGEPLLFTRWPELVDAAAGHGLPCRVLTNGTLVAESSAQALSQHGVRLVQVSLEGPEPIHDAIRGAGTFALACAGIRRLAAAGLEVTVSMTLSRRNAGALAAVAAMARDAGARRFHVARLVPLVPGRAIAAADLLDARELKAAFKELWALRRALRTTLEIVLRDPLWREYLKVSPWRTRHIVGGCSAGFHGLALDADGTLYPCRRLPLPLGHALEVDWWALWQTHPRLLALRDRDALGGRCGTCRRRWICGGCRAVAHAVSGDARAEDPQCFARRSWLRGPRGLPCHSGVV